MTINEKTIECFRRNIKEQYGEELSFVEAKGRYLNLMHMFWVLEHRAPRAGEPPRDPPPPLWL